MPSQAIDCVCDGNLINQKQNDYPVISGLMKNYNWRMHMLSVADKFLETDKIKEIKQSIKEQYEIDIESNSQINDDFCRILQKEFRDIIEKMSLPESIKYELFSLFFNYDNLVFDVKMLCLMAFGNKLFSSKGPDIIDNEGEVRKIYKKLEDNDDENEKRKDCSKKRYYRIYRERIKKTEETDCEIHRTSKWCKEFRDASFGITDFYMSLSEKNDGISESHSLNRYSFYNSDKVYNEINNKSIENIVLFEQVVGYALTQIFYEAYTNLPNIYGDGRKLIINEHDQEKQKSEHIVVMQMFAQIPYIEFRLKLAQIYLKDFPHNKPKNWIDLLKKLGSTDIRDTLMDIYFIKALGDMSFRYKDALEDALELFKESVRKEYKSKDKYGIRRSVLSLVSSRADNYYKKQLLEDYKKVRIPNKKEMLDEIIKEDLKSGILSSQYCNEHLQDYECRRYDKLYHVWKQLHITEFGDTFNADHNAEETINLSDSSDEYNRDLREQKEFISNINYKGLKYTKKEKMSNRLKYAILHAYIMDTCMKTMDDTII